MKGISLFLLGAITLMAQEEGSNGPPPREPAEETQRAPSASFPTFTLPNTPELLGGALLGLALHESGHILANLALNTHPTVKRVETMGIPFFAISHRRLGSPREEYAIASAGFWFQHTMAEILLARHPRFWCEASLVERGALLFHLATSLVYTYGALAKSGPPERDTRNMAQALGIHERWIGLAVLTPALLDLYRSFHPEARAARWTSRALKVSFVFGLTR